MTWALDCSTKSNIHQHVLCYTLFLVNKSAERSKATLYFTYLKNGTHDNFHNPNTSIMFLKARNLTQNIWICFP